MEEQAQQESRTEPRVGVIGSGIVGSAVAYALSVRGASVTILDEAEPLSREAATVNTFGWLSNQAFFRAKDPVPEAEARAYFDLHRRGIDAWHRLEDRLGSALGLRWTGTVQWATHEDDEAERLRRELERRIAWGSPSEEISAERVQRLLPEARVDKVAFAFHTPDEGTVDPTAAVPALLEAARKAGARLRFGARVLDLRRTEGGSVSVVSEREVLDFDAVVIACGRSTTELAERVGIAVPLLDSTGELVHLEVRPRFLDPLVMGPRVHVQQRHDGRVVLGRHFTGQPLSDVGSLDADALVADAVELFPALAGARVERIARARRIVPADAIPIWGESRRVPGAHALATNAGVSLGPLLGELVAEEILGGRAMPELQRYRADRFEN